MTTQQLKNHLDDVERHLKRAKRECQSGSELERHIKRALSALDDAQRECGFYVGKIVLVLRQKLPVCPHKARKIRIMNQRVCGPVYCFRGKRLADWQAIHRDGIE